MVSRKPTTPAAMLTDVQLRNLLRTATSTAEIEVLIANAKKYAAEDPKHLKWYLEFVIGRAKVQALQVPDLDLPDLDSLDACIQATTLVLHAQQDGELSEEQAKSYRDTIQAAAQMHRSKAGETVAEALEDAGSQVLFLSTTDDIETQIRDAANRLTDGQAEDN